MNFKNEKNVLKESAQIVKNKCGTIKDNYISKIDPSAIKEINIETVIMLGMKTPGIKIDRKDFLTKELNGYIDDAKLTKMIETTPLEAGVDSKLIDKVANDVIKFERNSVSGISTVLGMPGGLGMVATIPADIVQYYGYMLRVAQKLMYLYGFPQLDIDNEILDSSTLNTLILCLGVMYGVAGANNAIKVMAKALAVGINKKFMQTAVTKGTIYPIVKSVAKWFGITLTKKMTSGVISKSVPIIGGVVAGTLTYVTFKPCCEKLKIELSNTARSKINYIETHEEKNLMEDLIKEERND